MASGSQESPRWLTIFDGRTSCELGRVTRSQGHSSALFAFPSRSEVFRHPLPRPSALLKRPRALLVVRGDGFMSIGAGEDIVGILMD